MSTVSTAAADVKGLLKALKLAMLVLTIASITGCGVSHTTGKLGTTGSFAAYVPNQDPPVVFMGDSITAAWSQGSDLFQAHPAFVDAGISGNDSGQMVDRFATDVLAHHPTQVVILAGTNDAYPWFDMDNNWNTQGNITWMVQTARNNGITPILATLPPWGCAAANCSLALKADPSTATHLANTATINKWIVSYGAENGLIVMDFHKALVSADGQTYQPSLTLDGIHPSAAGYALMNPMVEDAIMANQWK